MSKEEAEECTQLLIQCISKIKAVYEARGESNATLSRIYAKLAEFNYDKRFLLTTLNHLKIIEKTLYQKAIGSNTNNLFDSEDSCLQYYISVFFLDKIEKYSNSTLPFNNNYVQPKNRIPLEAFLKPDKATVEEFEKGLKFCDVVFAEVVSTDFNELNREYIVLRIVNKIDDDKIVYNFDIKVLLFKEQELARLGEKQFQLYELLPVAILGSSIVNGVNRHFATTNMTILSKSPVPIDPDIIPKKRPTFIFSLYKEAKKYSSYAQYLEMNHFNQRHTLINGIKSLGLDPYHVYSFNEEEEELISPEGFHIGALKNATLLAQQEESNEHLEKGNIFVEGGDILNALFSFDEALTIWPDNYRVFEYRGRMYADFRRNKQFCDLKKASLDFTKALKINPNANVKKDLSDIYTCIAKKLIKKKKYVESKKNLQAALILNKDNQTANKLLEKINKKISNSSKPGDSELISLNKKREQLLMALDKE